MIELLFSESILPVVISVLIFGAFVLMATSIGSLVSEWRLSSRRLALPQGIVLDGSGGGERISIEDGVLASIAKFVTPSNIKELTKIRQRLVRAGYRRPSAVRIFYLSKTGLALGLALIAAVALPLVTSGLSTPIIGLLILVFMLVGYFFPSYWVERKYEYRKKEAELGFPDVLDLMLVCVEAGNSVDQALWRVVKEIRSTNPVLADELGVANEELRAGKERADVFRDFAARVNVEDISVFATVMRQSDEFGVSIADTLRVYASEMRYKRIMRAEEKANIMPLKLAMGTLFFTVPPIMFIMGGPAVLAILRAFEGMGR